MVRVAYFMSRTDTPADVIGVGTASELRSLAYNERYLAMVGAIEAVWKQNCARA